MKKTLTTLLAAMMLVGLMALPAGADDDEACGVNLVSVVVEEAEKKNGRFNIISSIIVDFTAEGKPFNGLVDTLATADLTVFLPTDFSVRRVAASLTDQRVWRVSEAEAKEIVLSLGDAAVAGVIANHIYAGDDRYPGKVDYRTARSLDENRRNGISGDEATIGMFGGASYDLDRRGPFLQVDDDVRNPFVVRRNIDAGNAFIHGINGILGLG